MQVSNTQNPHASYLLRSILFVGTKIGRIIILLGGMIYGRRRIIFVLAVIFHVSYLQRLCKQGFLRKGMICLRGFRINKEVLRF